MAKYQIAANPQASVENGHWSGEYNTLHVSKQKKKK